MAPIVGHKPSSGTVLGAAVNRAVYVGASRTTRISSTVTSLTVSSKKQTSLTNRFGVFTRDNRLRTDGDNRFQWTSGTVPGSGAPRLERDDRAMYREQRGGGAIEVPPSRMTRISMCGSGRERGLT